MATLIISNVTQLEQFPGSPSQQLVGQVSKNRVWKQVSWNLKIPPFAFFSPQENCKGTHPSSLENFFSSPDVVLFRGLNKPKGQMCHSNIIFHMHRAIKQMANVWHAKCQQRAICIATAGRGKGELLMHYLCYARSLCTNFVPQGIRRLLLICPLGKATNQSWRGNTGRYTYNAFQTNIPEFWMKLLSQTHISNMCIFFFVENYIHLPCLRAGRPLV